MHSPPKPLLAEGMTWVGSKVTFLNFLAVGCLSGEGIQGLWVTGVVKDALPFYQGKPIPLISDLFPEFTVQWLLAAIVAALIVGIPIALFKTALGSGLRHDPGNWIRSPVNMLLLGGGVMILLCIVSVETYLLAESARAGLALEPCDPVKDFLCTPLSAEEEAARIAEQERLLKNAAHFGAFLSAINLSAGFVTALVLDKIKSRKS